MLWIIKQHMYKIMFCIILSKLLNMWVSLVHEVMHTVTSGSRTNLCSTPQLAVTCYSEATTIQTLVMKYYNFQTGDMQNNKFILSKSWWWHAHSGRHTQQSVPARISDPPMRDVPCEAPARMAARDLQNGRCEYCRRCNLCNWILRPFSHSF